VDEDLLALSEDVLYEMWMVERTTHGQASELFAGEPMPDWLSNTLLDDFAIHARALAEFFYEGQVGQRAKVRGRRARTHVVRAHAHDFFDDDTWRRHRPKPKPEALRAVGRRVGSEIGHLTYGRAPLAEQAKAWPYGTIFLELARTFRAFLAVVPSERVVPDFLERGWSLLPTSVQLVSPRPADRLKSVDDLRKQAMQAAVSATVGMPPAKPQRD
jgi:hypothetical protein